MKFFVALVALTIVVSVNGLTDEQKKRAQEHVKKCKAEVGLEPGIAAKVRAGNFSAPETTDHKAKCFIQCFFRETGFMNEKGEPQRDVIISKLVSRHGLDREFVTDLVDKCIKEKGHDTCETAYNIFQCYRKNRVIKEKIQSYSTATSVSGQTSSTTPVAPVSTTNAGSSTTPAPTTTKAANPTTSGSWFGK